MSDSAASTRRKELLHVWDVLEEEEQEGLLDFTHGITLAFNDAYIDTLHKQQRALAQPVITEPGTTPVGKKVRNSEFFADEQRRKQFIDTFIPAAISNVDDQHTQLELAKTTLEHALKREEPPLTPGEKETLEAELKDTSSQLYQLYTAKSYLSRPDAQQLMHDELDWQLGRFPGHAHTQFLSYTSKLQGRLLGMLAQTKAMHENILGKRIRMTQHDHDAFIEKLKGSYRDAFATFKDEIDVPRLDLEERQYHRLAARMVHHIRQHVLGYTPDLPFFVDYLVPDDAISLLGVKLKVNKGMNFIQYEAYTKERIEGAKAFLGPFIADSPEDLNVRVLRQQQYLLGLVATSGENTTPKSEGFI